MNLRSGHDSIDDAAESHSPIGLSNACKSSQSRASESLDSLDLLETSSDSQGSGSIEPVALQRQHSASAIARGALIAD